MRITASRGSDRPREVYAAMDDATVTAADVQRRTITGLAVKWGQWGITNVGPSSYVAGSINVPASLRRVKLLIDHDKARAVGYLQSYRDVPEGVEVTFYVPEGPAGDDALMQAANGTRDALSVGTLVTGHDVLREGIEVHTSDLYEVSLVSIPAFADAVVTRVSAQHEGEQDMQASRTTQDTGGSGTSSGTTTQDTGSSGTSSGTTTQDAGSSGTSSGTTLDTGSSTSREQTGTGQRVTASQDAQRTREAVASGGRVVVAERRTTPPGFALRAALDAMRQHLADGQPAASAPMAITAALNDVTVSNITTPANGQYGPNRPDYITDLWQAADVERPTLDAFGPVRRLTSLDMWGWVWDVRPVVARYSGNKAAVPSNSPKRKRVNGATQRFAGGWDIDRAFVDLPNGTDELEDHMTEATRSYKEQSEAWAAELVANNSSQLYGDAVSVPSALAIIGSYFAKLRGARLSYVQMGTEAWDAFANMSADEAPWWLRAQGKLDLGETEGEAGGVRFTVNPDLDGTLVTAADKRAARFRELDPIKVRALDVANGGIDLGVFGYVGGIVSDPRAIVTLDIAGRVDPGA